MLKIARWVWWGIPKQTYEIVGEPIAIITPKMIKCLQWSENGRRHHKNRSPRLRRGRRDRLCTCSLGYLGEEAA